MNSTENFDRKNEEIDEAIEKKFRDLKLERKIIAYAVRKDYNIVFSISRDCFTLEPYQNIFDLLKTYKMIFPRDILYRYLKKKVDSDQLEIHKHFVIKIYNESLLHVNRKNIDEFIRKLKELEESRKLMGGINEVISNMDSFDLGKAKRRLQRAIFYESIFDKKHKGELLDDYEERRDRLIERKNNPHLYSGIPTGIKEFDELSGGLMKGEFGIIVAPTGMGKSLALGNIALNSWLKGYNSLIVSLEMTKEQIQFRMDSRLTRIAHTKFRKADLNESEMRTWEEKIEDFRRDRKNFMEFVCLHRGCCAMEVEEEAMKIQARRRKSIDLIIVDYINLMNANDQRGDKRDWKQQSEVGWNIKELSMNFNGMGIPIWTANQLTDEGNKAKKIEAHHLKYSRGISEVAPVILWLNQTIDDSLEDVMKLWIIKCRDFKKMKRPIILHPKFNIMALNDEIRIPEKNIGRI